MRTLRLNVHFEDMSGIYKHRLDIGARSALASFNKSFSIQGFQVEGYEAKAVRTLMINNADIKVILAGGQSMKALGFRPPKVMMFIGRLLAWTPDNGDTVYVNHGKLMPDSIGFGRTLAHEFGHCLGLEHPVGEAARVRNIMNQSETNLQAEVASIAQMDLVYRLKKRGTWS